MFSHWYSYEGGHQQRDEARAGMPKDSRWTQYLSEVRPYVHAQSSLLFAEAPLVKDFGLHGFTTKTSPASLDDDAGRCIYEYRRYQLKLGYGLWILLTREDY